MGFGQTLPANILYGASLLVSSAYTVDLVNQASQAYGNGNIRTGTAKLALSLVSAVLAGVSSGGFVNNLIREPNSAAELYR